MTLPHLDTLQRAFGPRHDLSSVRAHVGGQAASISAVLGADAFALGNYVGFSRAPSLELAAHEAAHVVQARAGQDEHSDVEQVADDVAHGVARGEGVADRLPHAKGAPRAQVVLLKEKPTKKQPPRPSLEQQQWGQTLLSRFPWLARLPNLEQILEHFAARLLLSRATDRLEAARVWDGDDARADRIERELDALRTKRSELSTRVAIDITWLLHADVLPDAKDPSDVGRAALYADLVKRGAYVEMDATSSDATNATLRLFLNPHWEVPVREDGVHLAAFLAIQQLNLFVYTDAILRRQRDIADDFLASNPEVYEDLADALQADFAAEDEAARDAGFDPETADVETIQRERARYAEQVRERYIAATAPIGMVLEVLLPAGPLDVLLSVAPVGRIGKGAWALGKRALQFRRVAKTERELAIAVQLGQRVIAALDDTAISFIRLGEKVAKRELMAAKRLGELGADYTTLRRLLDMSSRKLAEIEWLAKLVGNKKLDLAALERITMHESKVPWSDLQKIVEKLPIEEGTRSSVMSKLVGVLGEEAAEKLLVTKDFAAKLEQEGFSRIRRGVRYARRGSFDIVASGKGNFVFTVFAEVKNWAAATWQSDLKKVISQLERHNAGVDEYFSKLGGKATKRTAGKVLMVAEDGFKGLSTEVRSAILAEVRKLGWRVERIPQAMVRTGDQFIDALR